MRSMFIILCVLCWSMLAGEVIGEGLTGEALHQYVVQHYKTNSTLGYNLARDVMYSEIDLEPGNVLRGVYSGYSIVLDLSLDPSTDAYNKGINCEHTWPQSMGADSEPQRSDMHHLYPSRVEVNSSRGNDPFNEIPDSYTDNWYKDNYVVHSIPTVDIDWYSEKENDGVDCFEPREMRKGDIARSMFYFYCMYQDAADVGFWNQQKDILLVWNYLDPADDWETNRTWSIASYQENKPNPFVLDPTLAARMWFPSSIPQPPTGLVATASGSNMQLSWNAVTGATGYIIEASGDMDTWEEVDVTTATSWSTPIAENRRYFRVRTKAW